MRRILNVVASYTNNTALRRRFKSGLSRALVLSAPACRPRNSSRLRLGPSAPPVYGCTLYTAVTCISSEALTLSCRLSFGIWLKLVCGAPWSASPSRGDARLRPPRSRGRGVLSAQARIPASAGAQRPQSRRVALSAGAVGRVWRAPAAAGSARVVSCSPRGKNS